MAEFDTLLQRYGEVSAEVVETQGYLSHLLEEREAIRKRLKIIVKNGAKTETPADDDHETKSFDGAIEETVKAVAELGNSVSAAQLAERLGISPDAARLRLQRAEKKRRIIRVSFGRYAPKPSMQIVRPVAATSVTAEPESTTSEGGDTKKRTA